VLVDVLVDWMRTKMGVWFLKSSKSPTESGVEWEEMTDKCLIHSKFSQAFHNLKASYKREQRWETRLWHF
jgi:hypothetical protein